MHEGQGGVEDSLLGARRWQDLGLGVQSDAVATLHPAGEGLAQLALAWCARVLANLGDAGYKGPPYLGIRRLAGVAGTEIEGLDPPLPDLAPALLQARSEERRVGK